MNYWGTLKEVFTNKAFVIIFLFLGGAMSFISCLATKMEQIMCRSDQEYIILVLLSLSDGFALKVARR